MTACETCWNEAYFQSRLLGGHQADHYRRLLDTRDDCTTPTTHGGHPRSREDSHEVPEQVESEESKP